MTSWFISDIHLKDINERNGNTLLRFLFYLNQNPKQHRLFMLGDIFDFWLSDGKAFQKKYQALIDQIAEFKKAGGEVHYFEGNHDFHVDVFWTKKLNIPVYEEEAFFKIDHLNVRLEHGDFINPDDKAYLKYRATIRHKYLEPLGHIVPGWFWKWFGERQSLKSRKRTGYYAVQNAERVTGLIRSHAERMYELKPFDLIVTGHMHIFDDYVFSRNGHKVRSVNLGTWLDFPRALKIEDGQLSVVSLNEMLG
ncbi:MAG: UDP-2,3-diacylglucosamine diphosphatase [Bdellovibrionaceae bacterium]|nr:UDP-2,3-diacylglucosamine diphosphatase [Bdellovibrio sp.]